MIDEVKVQFLGAYVGSAIAAISALFAFAFTYSQNNKMNAQTQERMDVESRLSIIPFINMEFKLNSTVKEYVLLHIDKPDRNNLTGALIIKNVGLAAAVGINFHYHNYEGDKDMDLNNLELNKEIKIGLHYINELNLDNYIFYKDLFGRKYRQRYLVYKNTNDTYTARIHPPEQL